jgi:hypothetical protein
MDSNPSMQSPFFTGDLNVPLNSRGRASGWGVRLRKRAAWVNEAVASLRGLDVEGKIINCSGGKTSGKDLTSYVRNLLGDSVKLVGGKRVHVGEPSDEGLRKVDIILRLKPASGEVLSVSLGVLCRLMTYVSMRPRTKDLLLTLRAKGAQYGREIGLAPEHLALVIGPCVAVAMKPSKGELDAASALRVWAREIELYSEATGSGVIGGARTIGERLRCFLQDVNLTINPLCSYPLWPIVKA